WAVVPRPGRGSFGGAFGLFRAHGASSSVCGESGQVCGETGPGGSAGAGGQTRSGVLGGADCFGDGGAFSEALVDFLLQFADDRQQGGTEVGDVLVVVEESEEEQVRAARLVLHDAACDLLGGADQPGAETVVVLHEVVEGGVSPH